MEIALDGESALDKASYDVGLHCEQKLFYILQYIHNKIYSIPIKVEWRWVDGHQNKKGKTLDR